MTVDEQLNATAQKEAADRTFKQNAKIKAVEVAQSMRPYAPDKNSLGYDVVGQAERIYQWLIKDL